VTTFKGETVGAILRTKRKERKTSEDSPPVPGHTNREDWGFFDGKVATKPTGGKDAANFERPGLSKSVSL